MGQMKTFAIMRAAQPASAAEMVAVAGRKNAPQSSAPQGVIGN
jgi:hypothetical protein